eukprot:scaffold2232_cov365-Prasinococcus_capsulatus_cf.AAC.3
MPCGLFHVPPRLLTTGLVSILNAPKKLEDSSEQGQHPCLKASKNSAFCSLKEYSQQQIAAHSANLLASPNGTQPTQQKSSRARSTMQRTRKSDSKTIKSKPESKNESTLKANDNGEPNAQSFIRRIGRRKSLWTDKEDKTVTDLVGKYGLGKWKLLARQVGTKTPKQIHARWRDYLRPGIRNDKPWTVEELRRLATLHKRVGNHWTDLAGMLPGRSANAIKNRINAARRRRRMTNETEREIWAYLKEETP